MARTKKRKSPDDRDPQAIEWCVWEFADLMDRNTLAALRARKSLNREEVDSMIDDALWALNYPPYD